MSINRFKDRSYNKKPSYMRYDDVFISKNGSNYNRNYRKDNEDEYEEKYFSRDENGESNILHEPILKYKKNQMPPLQRYKSPMNARGTYDEYYDQPTYWDVGQEELYGTKRYQGRNDGAFLRSIWQKFFLTFVAILLLVCVAWIAYNCGNKGDTLNGRQNPMFIEPEAQDFKVLPDNPGGINVPHKDKMIYSRINGDFSDEERSESLLPSQEKASIIPQDISIDEYSVVDERTYYIKVSSNKNREVLGSELGKISKKYSDKVGGMQFSIKSVRDKNGDKQYALLIGPATSKEHAIDTAKELNTNCSVIAVKE
jgi:cbb3-type cytochrome oxidase subunit 3